MKKIRNSDFIVTLPDEVAGLELNGGDSVTMRIYTVNADNFYQFSYAGGLVPAEQKVDASMMATMESGVVQQLTIAHIADATMPDGFLDIAMEVSTDYYWIKSQYESAQEQIAQLRRDLEEEEEVREASDDAINNRIDFIDDEIDGIEDDIDSLSGQVATNTSAISDLNDWQIRQDNQISGLSGSVDSAVVSLGSSITAETYQRTAADNYLSGAIRDEAAMRNAAISGLEVTHNEDIAYLSSTKLDVSVFEHYTGSTDTDIADIKEKETSLSGQVQTNITQIQTLDVKKMDVSGMTTYATKQYADDGLARKQNTLTAGEGINISGDVITCTVEFDPSMMTDYQPVSAMTDYATTGQVDTLATEVSGKLDATAYTPFDPSVLADYATLDYADAISGVTEEIADTLDQATEVTARSLNELRNTKLDASAYTPFDPSVLSDYATKQYVDDAIDDIDLSNYYDKTEVDGLLDDKQDVLSAGTGISINGNVISAQADMSNFYTKQEVDNAEQATSASLNELNLRIIDLSGNTFDDSVLANYQPVSGMTDYQPVSGMSSYATITYVDTQIGNINTALNNILNSN